MSQNDIAQLDAQLNEMISRGEILRAFDHFYGEEVVMQENSKDPIRGKEACRKHEEEFLDSIAEFHGAEVGATGLGKGVTFAEWVFDVTFKGGDRVKMTQVAVRHWRAGQVVNERFYYDTGS